MANLKSIMTQAWIEYRKETRFWVRGALPAARALKWATCLRRSWAEAKRASRNLAERVRSEAHKLIALTDEQVARIVFLEQAKRECVYLPAHVSMSREMARIQGEINGERK